MPGKLRALTTTARLLQLAAASVRRATLHRPALLPLRDRPIHRNAPVRTVATNTNNSPLPPESKWVTARPSAPRLRDQPTDTTPNPDIFLNDMTSEELRALPPLVDPEPGTRAHELYLNYMQVVGDLHRAARESRDAADPGLVRLVAVSKTKPASDILALYECTRHDHFGENYVQELVDKAKELPRTLQWHFIGHLQTNKAKVLTSIPNLYVVETVDSLKLARELDKHWGKHHAATREPPLRIFLQANTSGESSKAGFATVTALIETVRTIRAELSNLQVAGLMTIGEPGCGDRDFATLHNWAEQVEQDAEKLDQETPNLHAMSHPLELSMGMSDDYAVAIKHGSTNVRVGSAIFGSRTYKTSEAQAKADAARMAARLAAKATSASAAVDPKP
ncbi:YggS family pyridoxal phosphate enzyme [Allomyces macrogynus ATCC 38327]|uniref:Pyridoxal phosphate homeostasis protein n=1 Tax=Allomyces macrogynus (strain ATCC 38327) TaxID=578462 RepID=A0A0L0S901_ALLM3|nr:YggS family pyridoxal phosphate enzyme [Allomyces macrogynus ATCC 38327]|eukprot:KNE59048.1 YggS family pyridoxal phosphate enzyme [Allomyces macrogynus ATCC 38327]